MEMTAISENNMEFLTEGEKTPEELVDFLKTRTMFRRFDEVLRRVYPAGDLAFRLKREMTEISGELAEGIERKVRNWMKGKNVPKNREILFQICFSLSLDEEKASWLIGAASETGIHYRNPKELVYAYGLRKGLSYRETVALQEEIQEKYPLNYNPDHTVFVDENETRIYTRQIKDAFSQVSDTSELMDFFEEYGSELGRLHETAFWKFMDLMKKLEKPESLTGLEEQRYSVEKIVQTYMRMHVPAERGTAGYSLLQKVIKKYWPGESSLRKMQGRKEDVNRKTIILLYLITEEFDEEEEESSFYDIEQEEDTDTILAVRFKKMNLFLDSCGMNLLDAGNPFDYLVLYAMKTQEEEAASDRMEAVLNLLFES